MFTLFGDKTDEQLANKRIYSLKVLKTPFLSTYLARVLVVITAIFFISLFMPWQQNIRGIGKVTALNPALRPQTVQSAIPGMIKEWRIREGQFVNKGDTLIELSEMKDKYFDPNILVRLRSQIDAKKASLLAKELGRDAYRNQVIALREALTAKLAQVKNKVNKSLLEVNSDSIAFEAEKINYSNYANIFKRNKERYEAGNITMTKYQEMESKFNGAKAKLAEKENKFLKAKNELSISRTDLSAVQAEYSEKISKATSELQKVLSEINETEGQIAKLENEYSNVEVRRDKYYLIAPQSGYVVRALKVGIGEAIKEGEAVATIQPDNPELAVEMFVRAMDVPLISKNRKVRLQFDGWPALQFSGWPNVSVGTFGGVVTVIDRVNTRNGLFRILVTNDPEDDPWPEQLRIGSGTKGWVMLENVMIWYEIWRQLNGFPPSLYEEPTTDEPKYETSETKEKKDKK